MSGRFRRLSEFCRVVVARGSQTGPTSERAYYAHCLFAKVTLHAESLLTLRDGAIQRNQIPDVGGIAVLARCIIEVRNTTAYLLEPNISKLEAELRLRLLSLNQSIDLSRINRGMDTSHDDTWSRFSIEHDRAELERNPIFAALDEEHKKTLLRGRSPFQYSRYRGKRPLPVTQESAIYTLLSHSAHAFGLGLSPFAGYGSRTPAGIVNSLRIASAVAELYLADCAKAYCSFRRRAVGKLSPEDAELLAEAANPAELQALFRNIRAGAVQ